MRGTEAPLSTAVPDNCQRCTSEYCFLSLLVVDIGGTAGCYVRSRALKVVYETWG